MSPFGIGWYILSLSLTGKVPFDWVSVVALVPAACFFATLFLTLRSPAERRAQVWRSLGIQAASCVSVYLLPGIDEDEKRLFEGLLIGCASLLVSTVTLTVLLVRSRRRVE